MSKVYNLKIAFWGTISDNAGYITGFQVLNK